MKKRILSIIIAVFMIASMGVAIPVFAEVEGFYTYEVINGGAVITKCNYQLRGMVLIPSTLGGYPVTGIGNWAMNGKYDIKSVKIPDSVTSIGNMAFYSCIELKSVELGDGVKSLGYGAFRSCRKLENISFSANLKVIEPLAFDDCENLTDVYYKGSKGQWNEIDIRVDETWEKLGVGNYDLINANIHFADSTEEKETISDSNQIKMTVGSKTAKIGEKSFEMDAAPVIINDRTMLPARYVTEYIGGEIEWIPEYNMVAVSKGSYALLFKIGSDSASFLETFDENEQDELQMLRFDRKGARLMEVFPDLESKNSTFEWANNYVYYHKASQNEFFSNCCMTQKSLPLDVAPIIINGRTFMPVRIIATFLGAEVSWDNDTKTVTLEKVEQEEDRADWNPYYRSDYEDEYWYN